MRQTISKAWGLWRSPSAHVRIVFEKVTFQNRLSYSTKVTNLTIPFVLGASLQMTTTGVHLLLVTLQWTLLLVTFSPILCSELKKKFHIS